MLIGGDDISNDVITLCTCFSMFVNIRTFEQAILYDNELQLMCIQMYLRFIRDELSFICLGGVRRLIPTSQFLLLSDIITHGQLEVRIVNRSVC